MFENLFGQGEYYDFPSFEIALYSLLLSFVLSTVIALTYKYTYEGDVFPRHFFQAIVLSSMVTCMVIMAVGNNVAAGFGIIGAVAIIRFRTLVRDPRNIIFIFASLSIGIAAGVYGYAIAIAGTALFCLVAFLLFISPFGKVGKKHFELTFTVIDQTNVDKIVNYLIDHKVKYKIITYRKLDLDRGFRYSLRITLNNSQIDSNPFDEMIALEGLSDIRISPMEEVQL